MDIVLSQMKGIGPKRLEALKAAGVETVRQLLCCLPVDYLDLTTIATLDSLSAGDSAAVEVTIKGAVSARYFKGLHVTRSRITDGTDTMTVVWYNQPWLKNQLRECGELLLYGKVEAKGNGLQLTCPTFVHECGLIPIYKTIGGISTKVFRQLILQALKLEDGQWPDELPESLRRRHGLCERNFAMRAAHMPESREALLQARRRLAFEELLLYQVAVRIMKSASPTGIVIKCEKVDADVYWTHLPYAPTNAQRRVLHEIVSDLNLKTPMARLVQGDVGCGKTAVAFGALYLAARGGFQGALMAPTEVLAGQHHVSAQALLEPLGITCGLLTGSLTAKEKAHAHEQIQSGAWQVVIGTHALISDAVHYQNLGLVITDEQHRFGVKQRTAFSQKGDAPNVLVMSATPIPRTLSLIVYGDLDISIIDELPPGRTPVRTRLVPDVKRDGLIRFIKEQVAMGHQVYIVCPLVEESEAVDAKPAELVYEELASGALKNLRVGLGHGRMKSSELDHVLTAFRNGEIDVLVATTVIEVGVNVPNASVMVIESAERFGLAQLHQLRGRVGRGAAESWCFLMAESGKKLKLLTETNDGFKIAEKDLELRGAGELFGYRQSGLTINGISSLAADTRLLEETHHEARELFTHRESEETIEIIKAAKSLFERRLSEIAMN